MLAAGLGIFGLLAAAARFNDKASRIPYVSCFDVASAVHPCNCCIATCYFCMTGAATLQMIFRV